MGLIECWSLSRQLHAREKPARCRAARSLAATGDRRAVRILLKELDDWSLPSEVRCAVARALGELGDKRAVPALRQVLQLGLSEMDQSLIAAATEALRRLGHEPASRH